MKFCVKNLYQCHLPYHKLHIYWSGIELGLQKWDARVSIPFPIAYHGPNRERLKILSPTGRIRAVTIVYGSHSCHSDVQVRR